MGALQGVRISLSTGIAGHVAQTGETVNVGGTFIHDHLLRVGCVPLVFCSVLMNALSTPPNFIISAANLTTQHLAVISLSVCADAYEDHRFDSQMDSTTGFRTQSILAMPVVNEAGARLGVVQAINRVSDTSVVPFDDFDEYMLGCVCSVAANVRLSYTLSFIYDLFDI